MKHTESLQEMGLAKNEALLYETLLARGELGVGELAIKAQVHRRNVYDTLARLVEKGLVFEVIGQKESHYQAVDPNKLREKLAEKERILEKALPSLEGLYQKQAGTEEVYILKGREGWKMYMRDILRLQSDVHTIGAKGGWNARNLGPFFDQFTKEAKELEINFYILYDTEARHEPAVKQLDATARFLPKEFSSHAAVDIFADRVVTVTHGSEDPDELQDILTVIVNPVVADAYRRWWQFMWDQCKK